MLPPVLYGLACLLADLALVRCRRGRTREVELLALRQEVRVLRRRVERPAWQPGDRFVLAAWSRRLPRAGWSVLPVRPETLLRWHREPVRRRWASFGRRRGPGRPPLPAEVRDLIERLASENPAWGDQRIRGESLEVGHGVSATAIRTILRRHGLPPAPRRGGLSWGAFLRAHAGAVLASNLFTVATVRLQTLYVLVFIAVHTRRVFVAGCTARPTGAWVTQQARNLVWRLRDDGVRPTPLIHDRDARFSGPSTTCSDRRACERSGRRSGRRGPTPTPNAGSARSGASAWMGCSASAAGTSSRRCTSTSTTTTRRVRTRRSDGGHRWPTADPQARPARSRAMLGSVA